MSPLTERVHDEVRVEHVADDAVALLVMEQGDDPQNAFQPSKVEAMTTAVEALAEDVDCLVLYGEPQFSVGADLNEIRSETHAMQAETIDTIAAASNRFIRTLRRFPAPVIAAVNGVAAGGGFGFALACDLIVMHEDAVLDTAYAKIGLPPDNATPFFLVATVGPYRARELLFDPEPITAAEAVDLGLVNERYDVPESEFIDAVTEQAVSYADGPTEMFARTKELVDTAFKGDLDEHLEEERAAIEQVGGSTSFDERLSAFLERPPEE